MTFDEVLAQVQELLQREKRVSYRGLKRRFALDDEYLEDLKEELVGAKRLAADEEGRFLVWVGEEQKAKRSRVQVKSRSQGRRRAPAFRRSELLAPRTDAASRKAAVDGDVL